MAPVVESASWETASLKGLSLLPPFLTSISDMPPTLARKYLYADDSALGYAAASFEQVESALEEDLEEIASYYSKWHLKLSMDQDKPKTVCSVFHLANKNSKQL